MDATEPTGRQGRLFPCQVCEYNNDGTMDIELSLPLTLLAPIHPQQ